MTRKTEWHYTRPFLYPFQLEAVFCEERYGVVEASTKSGKTTACLVWLFEQALAGEAGSTYWWVAPVAAQAAIAFRGFKRAINSQLYTANEDEMTVALRNGTVIQFRSADRPDSLYGDDVHAAVLDEASRMKEDAYHAVRSTLTATRGPLRIVGNVNGRRNWMYELARAAEAGEPGVHFARITAYDAVEAGLLAADEVEDARRRLPEGRFRELYLAEAADDQENPFGIAAIREAIAPLSVAEPVVWGWDLARSRDWTVGVALDRDGQVCRLERFQAPWDETVRRVLRATGRVRALVDSTGVGDPIVERLQREGGRNFGRFHFTAQSRQQLMEGLALMLHQGELRVPEGPITAELMAFRYEHSATSVRYAASSGVHDDCVMALALAASTLTEARRRRAGGSSSASIATDGSAIAPAGDDQDPLVPRLRRHLKSGIESRLRSGGSGAARAPRCSANPRRPVSNSRLRRERTGIFAERNLVRFFD